jgi:hypothetical protein
METAIDCLAAYSYLKVAFNVRCETTDWNSLASGDGVQSKQIVAESDCVQG